MSEQYYDHLKIPELKEILKGRKLKITGKKIELIDRLKDHDLQIKKDAGLILLFCKTMIGSYYNIWISRSDTILSLKNKIHEISGIPINKLKLEYGNKNKMTVLNDDSVIYDYGIYSESTIFITIKLL